MRSLAGILLAAASTVLLLVGLSAPAQAELQLTVRGVITVTYGSWSAEPPVSPPVLATSEVAVSSTSSAVPVATSSSPEPTPTDVSHPSSSVVETTASAPTSVSTFVGATP
jgi:hypothetical protein